MKIKSLIIALLITLMTSVVFAQQSSNDVNFYPEEFKVKNNNKVTIQMGASRGWESISISETNKNKEKFKYISLCTINNNIYAYTKNENTGIYKWEQVSDPLLNSLIDKSNATRLENLSNRIFSDLFYKSVSNSFKNDMKTMGKYFTEKSYVPFYFDVSENSKYDMFYSIAFEDYTAKHIIYGYLNSVSKLYNIEKFTINDDNKIEYNNICAFSLKELSNNTIPTLGNTENLSDCLKKYLDYLYNNEYPLFGNKYITNAEDGSYDKYHAILPKDGEKIALAAKRYLNWAVEYDLGLNKYEVPLMDDVDKLWGEENDEYSYNYWPKEKTKTPFPTDKKGISGNPIPYVKGGIDTPRTFWKKMQLSDNKLKILNKEFSYNLEKNILPFYKLTTYKSFQPGIGSEVFKYAGTDSLGFFTGVISMTEFQSEIKGINGIKSAENLNIYSKKIENITSANYKEYNNKSPEKLIEDIYKTNNVTFSWEDINFITEIVPTFDAIQEGDFLISDNNGNGSIAVVININSNKSVDIVFINEELYGTAKSINISSLMDYTARRLLVYNYYKKKPDNEKVSDVLDKTPDSKMSKISISNKYEATQPNKKDNWRFIPNTGEYLILDGIAIELKNSSCIDLLKLYGKEKYKLCITAKDRDYKENDTNGNINNNYADKFDVAIIDKSNDINKKETYKQNYLIKRKEIELLENGTKIKERQYNYSNPSLFVTLTDSGSIIYKDKTNETGIAGLIGIRPVNSTKAFPGDDLIIGFDVFDVFDDKEYLSKIWTNENDYIAVYDKKMLWRANLYIEETENDWNNMHPWNVPSTGSNGGPVWWDQNKWGNNEWNKKYNFDLITNKFETTALEEGTGIQNVIQIPSTRWYYGFWRSSNPDKVEKENLKTTAYDYQGWDTPFSYVAKIDNQKKLMNQWYSEGKQKYGKPKYLWKKTGATINEMKECLGETFTKNQKDSDIKTIYDNELKSKGITGELNLISKYHEMIFSSDYNPNNAPFNKAGLKLETVGVTLNRSNTDSEAVTLSGRNYYPYVPGLSDSIAYNNTHPDDTISYRVAGTDCIGLVQRSMSYLNNISNNTIYSAINDEKYRREPGGWENSTTKPVTAINNLHSESYAVKIGDKTPVTIIIGTKQEEDEYKEIKIEGYKYFKYLVPGDIAYYPGQHIMIVNSISEPKYTQEGEAYWEDGSGVNILENVYFGSKDIVGVSKKRDLSDLTSDNSSRWTIWRQK